eukprot:352122-Chlamydomonas_euryale.AAC.4
MLRAAQERECGSPACGPCRRAAAPRKILTCRRARRGTGMAVGKPARRTIDIDECDVGDCDSALPCSLVTTTSTGRMAKETACGSERASSSRRLWLSTSRLSMLTSSA